MATVKLPKLSEQQFTDQVVDLGLMNGWLIHHDRLKQNVQGTAGFPDLCMVHPVRLVLIFAELKIGKEVPEPAQDDWLQALRHGQPKVWVFVWYPADMPTITRILTGRR